MRVSTSQIYTLGVEAIGRQNADLLHSQQQIAAGRRILTPADDPIGAAQAVKVTQAADQLTQYGTNVDTAKSALSLNDSILGSITDVLQSVRTTAVNGGSGALADSDRVSLAGDVSARLQSLLALANSKDGDGRYLFSGFQGAAQPFVQSGSSIVYNGDQGQRELQVASGRQLSISENGDNVFQQVRNGNGTFSATPAAANAGTGVVDGGQVVNAGAVNGHSYRLAFHVSGGATTYDAVDLTTATTISSGNAYTDGSAITVGGEQVSISGAPADGDTFALAPSTQQSIFDTVKNLVNALQAPVTDAAGRARLANGINQALQNVDQALGNVLATRAGVGARLRELDSVTQANQDRGDQYAQTLSTLQDLDYNKALSDFARQQLALEAAQKSFLKVTGLSLFSYF
jgi:flagellar hook-associated protein 3 FlgL